MRIVFVGWGAIARTAADLITAGTIVGVAVRDPTPRAGLPPGARIITEPAELADLRPDVVAEAASREAVDPWGRAALAARADFIVSSVSAFADASVLSALRESAQAAGRQVHVQPGALAGIEALGAARLLGLDRVEHRIVKPPAAWIGTPAETSCDLHALQSAFTFFEGTAAETARAFPKNANVAMTTALAGVGPDRTSISLIADPHESANRHEIRAVGAFGELDVTISNTPLRSNPKTSALAALSLVRALDNRSAAVVI